MRTKMTAVFAIALLPLLAAASELKRGTIQVTGASALNLASGSSEQTVESPGNPTVKVKTDISGFDLEGGALYYVTPKIGVGLDVGFGQTKAEVQNETTTTTDVFLGPKVGADVGVAEKISVFGDFAVGFVESSERFTDYLDPTNDYEDVGKGWGYRLAVGAKYFVVPAVSVDLALGYRATSVSFSRPNGEDVTTKTNGFGVLAGLSAYFGR